MSEIISIHVGGCGVNVGLEYWRQLAKDRKQQKGDNGIRYDRLYYESQKGKSVPRAIFVDSDIRSNFKVSCDSIGFDTSNVIGYGNSCSVYAEGKYLQGRELTQQFQNSLQQEAQKCDNLSGFVISKSPTGGCGSGVGQNIISQLSSMNKVIEQFKIMPGTDDKYQYHNINPIQAYNTVLTNNILIQQIALIYTIETNAVQKILEKRGIKICGFGQINQYIGRCMTEHVSAYIEPGYLNTSQLKRIHNLVPYIRVKHMAVGLSEPNIRDYIRSSLDIDNRLYRYDQRSDKRIYALSVTIRENEPCQKLTHKKIDSWLNNAFNASVDWLPNTFHLSFSKITRPNTQRAYSIINGAKNIDWFRKISDQFTLAFRKRAFVHHYTSRGLDQMEFTQAESALNDLISEYTVYDAYVEDQNQVNYQEQ